MGLLDGTGDNGLGVYLGDVVDPASLQALQRQSAWNNLITTLSAMGAASGPSPRPVPLGTVAGQGALAGQEAQRQSLRDTLSGLQAAQAIRGGQIGNALNMLNLRGWQGI